MEEEIDLLANYHLLPQEIQDILLGFDEEADNSYHECDRVIKLLEQNGYTAEYGLDGELYDLKKV